MVLDSYQVSEQDFDSLYFDNCLEAQVGFDYYSGHSQDRRIVWDMDYYCYRC